MLRASFAFLMDLCAYLRKNLRQEEVRAHLAGKSEEFGGAFVEALFGGVLENRTPHADIVAHFVPHHQERLGYDVAFVLYILQRLEYLVPVKVSPSGDIAVVLARMEMS